MTPTRFRMKRMTAGMSASPRSAYIAGRQGDSRAPDLEVADTSGQHVARPVARGAVRQRDDVVVAATEHLDRSVLLTPRLAAAVVDHAEGAESRHHRTEEVVGDLAVEDCQ